MENFIMAWDSDECSVIVFIYKGHFVIVNWKIDLWIINGLTVLKFYARIDYEISRRLRTFKLEQILSPDWIGII